MADRNPPAVKARRAVQWLLVYLLGLGAAMTYGFYDDARDDQVRCEAGNEFRREDLPTAFDEYSDFLGHQLGADDDQIADAKARFAVVMDDLFPERECPLW